VEEVVTWDHKLRGTKTFSTGFLILSGRRFESPNLAEQQKILLNFIDQPAHDYFLSRSPQARAFEELKIVCKLGWKASSVTLRKRSGMCVLLRSIWLFCWCFDVRSRRRRRHESRQSNPPVLLRRGCPRPLLSSVPSESSGLFTHRLSSSTCRRRGMRRTWSIALPHSIYSWQEHATRITFPGGNGRTQVQGDVVRPLVPHAQTSDADALIR
jgi:hypothetical protein